MTSTVQRSLFIPPDLYSSIIEHVDNPSTLYSLLLVSHTANRAAEPAMYHSVSLYGINMARDLTFYKAVIASERRARHVRRLHVKFPHLVFFQRNNGYLRRLNAALLALINITVLSCDAHYVPPIECTFQLKEFRGAFMVPGRGLDYGPFLARQPHIERLEIYWEPAAPPPPTFCPNLTTLTGPTSTLTALLPGRAIRYLQWRQVPTYDAVMTPAEAADIAEPLRRLRSLSMKRLYNEPPFRAFAPYLEDLQYLELSENWTDHMKRIKSLQQLRGLTLWPCPTEDDVEMLFAAVASLRFVEGYDYAVSSFFRWDRDGRERRSVLEFHDWSSGID